MKEKMKMIIMFDPEIRNLLVKEPLWDKEQKKYVCQHCNSIVTTQQRAYGDSCTSCGLPICEV